MAGHGCREAARTILDEVLGIRPDFIEHQLAHAVRDPNGRAYNRTKHLKERAAMMQKWADYLDKLRTGGQVVDLAATREARNAYSSGNGRLRTMAQRSRAIMRTICRQVGAGSAMSRNTGMVPPR